MAPKRAWTQGVYCLASLTTGSSKLKPQPHVVSPMDECWYNSTHDACMLSGCGKWSVLADVEILA